MKIKSLILAGVFALSCFSVSANNSSLFSYDKNAVNESLKNVSAVEKYVNQNEGVTLNSLNSDGKKLVDDANLYTLKSQLDGPAGVPSFLWGFAGGCIGGITLFGGVILGLLGVLAVYLVTQDGDETKKALMGCIVGNLIWVVFFAIWFIFGNSWFLFY